MLRKLVAVLLLAVILVTVPQAARSSNELTPQMLQVEWKRILKAAPILASESVQLGVAPPNMSHAGLAECLDYPVCLKTKISVTSAPSEECLDFPRCGRIALVAGSDGVIQGWQHTLWHEAGHALHNRLGWRNTRQAAGFAAFLIEYDRTPVWEAWAESFYYCFSPDAPPITDAIRPRCAYMSRFVGFTSGGGVRHRRV